MLMTDILPFFPLRYPSIVDHAEPASESEAEVDSPVGKRKPRRTVIDSDDDVSQPARNPTFTAASSTSTAAVSPAVSDSKLKVPASSSLNKIASHSPATVSRGRSNTSSTTGKPRGSATGTPGAIRKGLPPGGREKGVTPVRKPVIEEEDPVTRIARLMGEQQSKKKKEDEERLRKEVEERRR
ncbi:hypothetical protein HDV00_012500, partial [Rhizophlyctis rosea]